MAFPIEAVEYSPRFQRDGPVLVEISKPTVPIENLKWRETNASLLASLDVQSEGFLLAPAGVIRMPYEVGDAKVRFRTLEEGTWEFVRTRSDAPIDMSFLSPEDRLRITQKLEVRQDPDSIRAMQDSDQQRVALALGMNLGMIEQLLFDAGLTDCANALGAAYSNYFMELNLNNGIKGKDRKGFMGDCNSDAVVVGPYVYNFEIAPHGSGRNKKNMQAARQEKGMKAWLESHSRIHDIPVINHVAVHKKYIEDGEVINSVRMRPVNADNYHVDLQSGVVKSILACL